MTTARRTRVLIVDDSAFARKVLRESLSKRAEIELVGAAADGLEALEKIADLRPDVVTLDLMMPHLDGLGVLRALPREDAPRVVVVSITDASSEQGVAALQAGAVEIVHKPTALATDRLYELEDELVAKVLVAAQARPAHPAPLAPPPARAPRPAARGAEASGIVVVGASTGGPSALTRLLADLPGDLPVPVAIVLHIPPGYTAPFARRVDATSALSVVEASEGLRLRPGLAVVARAGIHLKLRMVDGQIFAWLDPAPQAPHRPSIDVLFQSAAAICGAEVTAAVLTGMGSDGLAGAQAVHDAGGAVITEAESSCVVYGMPRAVQHAGLSRAQAPIEQMAGEILRSLERRAQPSQ